MLKKTLNVTIAFLICAMAFATAALADQTVTFNAEQLAILNKYAGIAN